MSLVRVLSGVFLLRARDQRGPGDGVHAGRVRQGHEADRHAVDVGGSRPRLGVEWRLRAPQLDVRT